MKTIDFRNKSLSGIVILVVAFFSSNTSMVVAATNAKNANATTSSPLIIAALNKSATRKVKDTKPDDDNYLVQRPKDGIDEYIAEVMKSLRGKVVLKEGRSALLSKLNNATKGQKAIYAVHLLHEKVNLGGFYNYFTSDAANLIPEAKKGLMLIGASKYLNLLNQALQLFADDGEMLDTTFDRKSFLDSLSADEKYATFEEVDYKFEVLEEDNMLKDSMTSYINEHPQQFFADKK